MVTGRALCSLGQAPLLNKHGNILSFFLFLLPFFEPHFLSVFALGLLFSSLTNDYEAVCIFCCRAEGAESDVGVRESLPDEMQCVNGNCHYYPLNKRRQEHIGSGRTGRKNWTANKGVINSRNCLNLPLAVSSVNTINAQECLNCI